MELEEAEGGGTGGGGGGEGEVSFKNKIFHIVLTVLPILPRCFGKWRGLMECYSRLSLAHRRDSSPSPQRLSEQARGGGPGFVSLPVRSMRESAAPSYSQPSFPPLRLGGTWHRVSANRNALVVISAQVPV